MSDVTPETLNALLRELKELDAYRQLNTRLERQIDAQKREIQQLRDKHTETHYNLITVVGIWQFDVLEQGDNRFSLDMDEFDRRQLKSGDTLLVLGEIRLERNWEDPSELVIEPYRIDVLTQPSDTVNVDTVVQLVE